MKKILTKNEFRFDTNPVHMGKKKEPHPAYITARQGHNYRANIITHAAKAGKLSTFKINENPNKLSKDKRPTRISAPYWQSDKLFTKGTLSNFRFSNQTRKEIRAINKKFK